MYQINVHLADLDLHLLLHELDAPLDDQILEHLGVLGIIWLGDFSLKTLQGLVHETFHQFVPIVHRFHSVLVYLRGSRDVEIITEILPLSVDLLIDSFDSLLEVSLLGSLEHSVSADSDLKRSLIGVQNHDTLEMEAVCIQSGHFSPYYLIQREGFWGFGVLGFWGQLYEEAQEWSDDEAGLDDDDDLLFGIDDAKPHLDDSDEDASNA